MSLRELRISVNLRNGETISKEDHIILGGLLRAYSRTTELCICVKNLLSIYAYGGNVQIKVHAVRDVREIQDTIHNLINRSKTTQIMLDAEMISVDKKDAIMRFMLLESIDQTRVLSPSQAEVLDYLDERGCVCRQADADVRKSVQTHILMQLAAQKQLKHISFIQLRVLFADFYHEVR